MLAHPHPLDRCKAADTSFRRVGSDDIYRLGFRQALQVSDFPGILKSFSRNALIYAEKDSASCFYRVMQGAVRSSKLLFDGRRQIAAFYLPGEVFGLELGSRHTFSAEATVPSKIIVIRRHIPRHPSETDYDLACQMWALTGGELQRAQDRLLLLAKTAPERVATFLLELFGRSGPGDILQLPMPRQDIADHLGLTIETVSRVLGKLEEAAVISIPTCKRIVLRNLGTLRRMAG